MRLCVLTILRSIGNTINTVNSKRYPQQCARSDSPKWPGLNSEPEVKGDEQIPNGNGLWFQLMGWKLCLSNTENVKGIAKYYISD